jgi:hypothetical protein
VTCIAVSGILYGSLRKEIIYGDYPGNENYAVIPDRDVVRRPFESYLELGGFG